VAASLDDTARGIEILPRTHPLRLQEGVYRPLQVHQGCTQVHCIMCMFGRLLGAIRNLYIYASIWIMRVYYMYRYVQFMCLRSLTSLYFKLTLRTVTFVTDCPKKCPNFKKFEKRSREKCVLLSMLHVLCKFHKDRSINKKHLYRTSKF
jgi:hypothetical protein